MKFTYIVEVIYYDLCIWLHYSYYLFICFLWFWKDNENRFRSVRFMNGRKVVNHLLVVLRGLVLLLCISWLLRFELKKMFLSLNIVRNKFVISSTLLYEINFVWVFIATNSLEKPTLVSHINCLFVFSNYSLSNTKQV